MRVGEAVVAQLELSSQGVVVKDQAFRIIVAGREKVVREDFALEDASLIFRYERRR